MPIFTYSTRVLLQPLKCGRRCGENLFSSMCTFVALFWNSTFFNAEVSLRSKHLGSTIEYHLYSVLFNRANKVAFRLDRHKIRRGFIRCMVKVWRMRAMLQLLLCDNKRVAQPQ